MPGLMEELNLKPGVIYGDDVLNVSLVFGAFRADHGDDFDGKQ